jgi:hypothetical protein
VKRVALILGAGFSAAAGLPLAADLLDSDVYAGSASARRRFDAVWAAWSRWHEANPQSGPEQFLQAVYEGRVPTGPPWAWAAELVGAVLATPRGGDWPIIQNPRYAGRITTPVRSPIHLHFWDFLLSHAAPEVVVTTNYDLHIERGLRHRRLARGRPGIHYGGIDRPQILKGLAQPFTVHKPDRLVELTGSVPLFKLHGSLNWSFEHNELVMYQECRAAFRKGGDAAIVPPLSEKKIPGWLTSIWRHAEQQLQAVDTWLVCGYSLPSYDHALRELFTRAGGNVATVYLLDPYAAQIAERWASVTSGAQVVCLPGIPDALARNFL